ncbi:MAG: imidazole glycerol phosphate synthase subunit HisH [Planctomycetaceae bacterium]|nr:imidazole glycerol phosphate synthase subunit HisH [Planctomycetaceae bacterium]
MIDVAIIDYQMSNLHSVQTACCIVGLSSIITSDCKQIMNAKSAILPGVGAFGEAMKKLQISKLDDCIASFIESGRPFVGICLGLQLLFESSEEFGDHKGLAIIKGTVKKLAYSKDGLLRYPVPHAGWNRIRRKNNWDKTLLRQNTPGDFMYFLHSYYVQPEDPKIVRATTVYGQKEYCSALQQNNIFAAQFHPEKSGQIGMRIYQTLKTNLAKSLFL